MRRRPSILNASGRKRLPRRVTRGTGVPPVFGVLAKVLLCLALSCDKPKPPPAPVVHHLSIAAAADLRSALHDLGAAYQAAHPSTELDVTYGASGTLYAQLNANAPFDIFLSADTSYPQKLVDAGLASPDALFPYANGHLVLWIRRDCGLDLVSGLATLTNPKVRKIAIANPRLAPYGAAADAALKSAHLYDAVKDKLVFGDNVSQSAQFVQSGAADIAFISRSLAQTMDGTTTDVPANLYPPIHQSGVVLPMAREPDLARSFRAYLTSDAGQAALQRHGFSPP